jgi:Cu/Ag efflux protein CusF
MIRAFMICLSLLMFAATAPSSLAQSSEKSSKKSYTLRGKVEEVNAKGKTLTVNHETVAGWMEAMTMVYSVDGEEVFKSVKPGDKITATVYDGDYTLHNVQVVPPAGK